MTDRLLWADGSCIYLVVNIIFHEYQQYHLQVLSKQNVAILPFQHTTFIYNCLHLDIQNGYTPRI